MSKEYKCEECGKAFDSKRGLHIHIGEVHPDKKEELVKKEEEVQDKEKTDEKEDKAQEVNKKGEKTQPGFFGSEESLMKPVIAVSLIGVLIAILLLFNMGMIPSFSPSISEGPEGVESPDGVLSATEAGQRALKLYSSLPQLQGAHVSLLNATETGSGVYKINLNLSAQGRAQIYPLYETKDGVFIFPATLEVENVDSSQISEDKAKSLAKTEVEGLLERDSSVNKSSVAVINSSESGSGVYAINIVINTQNQTQKLRSYLTKDGKYFFIRGANISAQLEQLERMEEQMQAYQSG